MKYSLINEKPEIFLKAVSKELKEKGQREMWKISSDILYRLNEYFINKWNKPKKTKQDFLDKKQEQIRFNDIKEYFETYKPSEKTKKFYREKMDKNPKYPIDSKLTELTSNAVPASTNPYQLSIIYNRDYDFSFLKDSKRFVNGFTFNKSNIKEIEPLIWKFVILHEEGHLFDICKKFIEGDREEIVGTAQAYYGSDEEYQKGMDMESGANAQAIDNMYRKDRREFLKQTTTSKKDIENISKNNKRGVKQMYLGKFLDKSKTYK